MSEVTNVYSSVVVVVQSDPGALLLLFLLLLPVVPWHYYVRDSNNKATQRVVFICLLTTTIQLFLRRPLSFRIIHRLLGVYSNTAIHKLCGIARDRDKGNARRPQAGNLYVTVGIGEILSHASFGVLNTMIHWADILLGLKSVWTVIQYVLGLGVPATIHHSVCDSSRLGINHASAAKNSFKSVRID